MQDADKLLIFRILTGIFLPLKTGQFVLPSKPLQ
jgi:hypothetical protein